MTIQYDGSAYKGWQKQNIKGTSVSTIQDKLENVLSKMTGEEIQVIGCGRTDAGVHARNYVANFKTDTNMNIDGMMKYVHMYLPEDIIITSMKDVSDRFHSRLNVKSKTYVYTIDNNKYADPFIRKYSYHIGENLNLDSMREATKCLLGTHDFQSFTSLKAKSGKSTIRTINYINIHEQDNIMKIEINGNGFLLNMVRILTGTLIDVGKGILEVDEVERILETKKRCEAGEKAPSKGLCMLGVTY